MSLFKNLFGHSDRPSNAKVDWKMLTDASQLDIIIHESAERPALIFKHSTRCGISRMTLKRFENEFSLEDKITPYYLDLLAHRDISNAISQQFNVEHQSPQLLLIKNGKVVYHTSHEAIDAEDLANRL